MGVLTSRYQNLVETMNIMLSGRWGAGTGVGKPPMGFHMQPRLRTKVANTGLHRTESCSRGEVLGPIIASAPGSREEGRCLPEMEWV